MKRSDAKASLLIHKGRIGVNVGEELCKPILVKDCFDEENVSITNNPQLTPEKIQTLARNFVLKHAMK